MTKKFLSFFLHARFAVPPCWDQHTHQCFFILGGDGGDRRATTLSWTVFSRNHRGGDTVVTRGEDQSMAKALSLVSLDDAAAPNSSRVIQRSVSRVFAARLSCRSVGTSRASGIFTGQTPVSCRLLRSSSTWSAQGSISVKSSFLSAIKAHSCSSQRSQSTPERNSSTARAQMASRCSMAQSRGGIRSDRGVVTKRVEPVGSRRGAGRCSSP